MVSSSPFKSKTQEQFGPISHEPRVEQSITQQEYEEAGAETREHEQPSVQSPETAPPQEAMAPAGHSRPGKTGKYKQLPQVRDELTLQIEHIMQDGLADSYSELTPIEQQEFKIKGEQAARQIRVLMRSTRVRVKKIFSLLFAWLSMLPGINKFFLMQEAKIKADKIVSLHSSSRQY